MENEGGGEAVVNGDMSEQRWGRGAKDMTSATQTKCYT
jgi:hypothetical protein